MVAGVALDTAPVKRPGKFSKPRPQVGLALLLLGAAFPVRFEVVAGYTGSLFDVAAAVCAVQLLFILAGIRTLVPAAPSLMRAARVTLAVTVLSMLWSHAATATILDIVSWAEALIVMVFVSTVLRDQAPVICIRWVARFGLLLLVAPVLMYRHVPGFHPPTDILSSSGDYLSYYTRLSHPFIGRSNNLATLLVVLFVPLAYWAARYRTHRLTATILGVAIVLTLSRGVLAGAAIAGFLLVVRSREQVARIARRLVAPLVVGALALLAAIAYSPVVANNISGRLGSANITGRTSLLHLAWSTIDAHPFVGLGSGVGENVHNTYIQQVVYFGAVLGLVTAFLIARAAASFFGRDDLSRAVGLGIVAALLSFLVESSLEGTLLRPLIFLCCALTGAVATSADRAHLEHSAATDRRTSRP